MNFTDENGYLTGKGWLALRRIGFLIGIFLGMQVYSFIANPSNPVVLTVPFIRRSIETGMTFNSLFLKLVLLSFAYKYFSFERVQDILTRYDRGEYEGVQARIAGLYFKLLEGVIPVKEGGEQ